MNRFISTLINFLEETILIALYHLQAYTITKQHLHVSSLFTTNSAQHFFHRIKHTINCYASVFNFRSY